MNNLISINNVLQKIANFVKFGSDSTQTKLCHAKSAKWISNNLDKNNYYLALWGVEKEGSESYVFHSGILTPSLEINTSYYPGTSSQKINSEDLSLEIPNKSLKLLELMTIEEFKNTYLSGEIVENTVSSDLGITVAAVDKSKQKYKDNHIYNEPDLKLNKLVSTLVKEHYSN